MADPKAMEKQIQSAGPATSPDPGTSQEQSLSTSGGSAVGGGSVTSDSSRPTIRRDLPPVIRDALMERKALLLKKFPRAFDPTLTPQERHDMELAIEAEFGGMSMSTKLNLAFFGLIVIVVSLTLYFSYNINVVTLAGNKLVDALDPKIPTPEEWEATKLRQHHQEEQLAHKINEPASANAKVGFIQFVKDMLSGDTRDDGSSLLDIGAIGKSKFIESEVSSFRASFETATSKLISSTANSNKNKLTPESLSDALEQGINAVRQQLDELISITRDGNLAVDPRAEALAAAAGRAAVEAEIFSKIENSDSTQAQQQQQQQQMRVQLAWPPLPQMDTSDMPNGNVNPAVMMSKAAEVSKKQPEVPGSPRTQMKRKDEL